MTTLVKSSRSRTSRVKPAMPMSQHKEQTVYVELSQIDICPLNYRKFFDQQALKELADDLVVHGLISPVILRKTPSQRYELVVGERRYRAAQIAGFTWLKSEIRELTDKEVVELQLSENMKRENPHPLHEAQGIRQLQAYGYTMEQIAERLSKPKGFIYRRLQLAGLIEPLQEQFLAGKFGLQDSMELASLATESQHEFYQEQGKNWEQPNFTLHNLYNTLRKYRYNLNVAPFNTKDKKLLPEAGACTQCPFNSATVSSLFPEMAKQAICTNKSCFQKKCSLQLQKDIEAILQQEKVAAIITVYQPTEMQLAIIETHPQLAELPRHQHHDIHIVSEPEKPDQDLYADNETGELDEEGLKDAMEDYDTDMEAFKLMVASGKVAVGLHFNGAEVRTVQFSTEKPKVNTDGGSMYTAKQVQEAYKAGTATEEMLQGEIDRLESRERRAKELDREKVQLNLHGQFTEQFTQPDKEMALTDGDWVAGRLMIFETLDYHNRSKVMAMLLENDDAQEEKKPRNQRLYEALLSMTDQQLCYMVRTALAGKAESKYPSSPYAYTMYKTAQAAGIDVQAIEDQQQVKIDKRLKNLNENLGITRKRLERLTAVKQ